jgi:hypothetical protein
MFAVLPIDGESHVRSHPAASKRYMALRTIVLVLKEVRLIVLCQCGMRIWRVHRNPPLELIEREKGVDLNVDRKVA